MLYIVDFFYFIIVSIKNASLHKHIGDNDRKMFRGHFRNCWKFYP